MFYECDCRDDFYSVIYTIAKQIAISYALFKINFASYIIITFLPFLKTLKI